MLRAQGMLAELHTVDLENADRGLRAYAAMTGIALHTVARQVVDRELTISREMCVPAPAPRRPQQCTDRYQRREVDSRNLDVGPGSVRRSIRSLPGLNAE